MIQTKKNLVVHVIAITIGAIGIEIETAIQSAQAFLGGFGHFSGDGTPK